MTPAIGAGRNDVHTSPYDLVVVGGGIQGTMLFLEAARRGLRVLLLEKSDFGGGTSWNSLRILHGGLRYLQGGDLARFRRSVRSRRWFFRAFPEFVQPLGCLMPLCGHGLERTPLVRTALWLNELMSAGRNDGVPSSVHIPRGRILDREEVAHHCAALEQGEFRTGALWFDGLITRPQRLLIESLRWAIQGHAVALNYYEATAIDVAKGTLRAVIARDRIHGTEHSFTTDHVVFCMGPDAPALRGLLGSATPRVPPATPGFNVVLGKPLPSTGAVAVHSRSGERLLFAFPFGSLTLAGTAYGNAAEDELPALPGSSEVTHFVEELADALPGWDIGPQDVVRVLHGVLPGTVGGTPDLARRPTIVELQTGGGPHGLRVVFPVKYTTAPALAVRVLDDIGLQPRGSSRPLRRPVSRRLPGVEEFLDLVVADPVSAKHLVHRTAREEAVKDPVDLVLRRTDWGLDPSMGDEATAAVARLLQGR